MITEERKTALLVAYAAGRDEYLEYHSEEWMGSPYTALCATRAGYNNALDRARTPEEKVWVTEAFGVGDPVEAR